MENTQNMRNEVRITEEMPSWKFRVMDENGEPEMPGEIALWSGAGDPPAVGDAVVVRMNQCGPGVVTGYLVQAGYLGVLVKLDEATRPDWHRKQHPDNRPSLAFGAELAWGG